MKRMKSILSIVFIAALLGIVGTMDYNDYVQMERYKCERGGNVWTVETNGDQYCK
ncbi:hypothetical protein [Haemophilus paraphrohaemolyticus]|uniref:Uncharacterized protein n=1 Tax=Haemophilus paraphrohaemolyticus HK411 TaxID=1095743 RepID=I2NCS6_9PAST|nr:hypothetical protein [Haemophilus paraphrohaemolyticus]EIG23637.1 hypothetical protein HMPREF1054_1924 [Haemophilus paraphrohaemolyticus HK411]STP02053.1 Uncharacterised protein [Haemophilus paraphrohaemolyticus]DAX94417.1 MAG TPA: hypothetical protein [Bacteriophage sp.]